MTYVLEVELLETDCHVLDPTPLENCTVRPKILTVRFHTSSTQTLYAQLHEFNQVSRY